MSIAGLQSLAHHDFLSRACGGKNHVEERFPQVSKMPRFLRSRTSADKVRSLRGKLEMLSHFVMA